MALLCVTNKDTDLKKKKLQSVVILKETLIFVLRNTLFTLIANLKSVLGLTAI
jgi:hypothetical protein